MHVMFAELKPRMNMAWRNWPFGIRLGEAGIIWGELPTNG